MNRVSFTTKQLKTMNNSTSLQAVLEKKGLNFTLQSITMTYCGSHGDFKTHHYGPCSILGWSDQIAEENKLSVIVCLIALSINLQWCKMENGALSLFNTSQSLE